ncbi:MAG: hypothetical protein KDJ75_10750, partial [Alphaproteobacteria bacterium]|nr:hypothetical protein [Alphaproteobacteria bacterium]
TGGYDVREQMFSTRETGRSDIAALCPSRLPLRVIPNSFQRLAAVPCDTTPTLRARKSANKLK